MPLAIAVSFLALCGLLLVDALVLPGGRLRSALGVGFVLWFGAVCSWQAFTFGSILVGGLGALRRGRRGGWIGVLVGGAGMLAFGWGLFVVARRLISHLGGA